jgi:hypothetical protein
MPDSPIPEIVSLTHAIHCLKITIVAVVVIVVVHLKFYYIK